MSTVETVMIDGESVPLTLANLDRIVFWTYGKRLRDAQAANRAALDADPEHVRARLERAEARQLDRARRRIRLVAEEAAERAREWRARRELTELMAQSCDASGLSDRDRAKAVADLERGTRCESVLLTARMAIAFDRLGELEEAELNAARTHIRELIDVRLDRVEAGERTRWLQIRGALDVMDESALSALVMVLAPADDPLGIVQGNEGKPL